MENVFIPYESKTKDDGVIVEKYKVNPKFEVTTKAIDPNTGNIADKPVTEFSIHKNIKLYKISDKKNRFDLFWASSDHSLIIYDLDEDLIEKKSPEFLLKIKDKNRYYFMQLNRKTKVCELLPIEDLVIEYDLMKQ